MVTKFIDINAGRIAYDESGSGPLVLAVPGMGDLRGEFRFLAPQLVQAGYKVVTMDVRGHGESSVDWPDFSVAGVGADIVALLRALGQGPAILVGNSMGGGAAVWAAAEAPELVEKLVLLDPAVRGGPDGSMRLVLKVLFARPWGVSAWMMYFKTLFPSRKPADFSEYTATLRKNLAQAGRLEALYKMMIASQSAAKDRLSRVRPGTSLVVMGSRDPDFKQPAEEARWVAGQLGGEVVMVEGAGHYPHTEMSAFTGKKVIEFLGSRVGEDAHARAGYA